ncbi:hypothetical protein [Micromonospora sagamiensis]|uniref:ATP synthase protein I n=1 Tax=Micromonospora sagamiensis TaxID=47875 RepID=A0A562WBE9_9ACTN|nr:hypothetical protein [Micromonospora sagamiensis]TWJ27468.1 hypothetical protein JD81_00958 [Micromonospora sagamiensis]BCL13646.1 hypothetical protein GCM10017556_13850 [Micromonospora sagamiensis]
MIRQRLRHLVVPLLSSVGLLVLVTGAGWLVDGGVGAAGGAAGVALVTFSYALSSLAVAWADSVHPKLVMSVGLTAYVTKFLLFGVVMFGVVDTGWGGIRMMAIAMIVATIGWVTAQVWWTFRDHRPQVSTPGD